ncbi:FGGY carbohydrate kinase domain-containing protein isoform X3 [Rhipicephalus microplus]|uniref:FGGY carbohydrate kinase domain-containing protein isoform X3 n=1 Tax=Rhipicephalus microplus TaxID=6941 RepID=UPI003F6B3E24
MQLLSVDVGTQSVRAALVTDRGRFLKTASRPLKNWNPQPGFYQQSSDQIWSACCEAIKEVCRDAKNVSGVGFDATCSLVVLDDSGRPLTVSPKGEPEQNVVLWMDHRAVPQAEAINATGHSVLRFMGGSMSPEMQPPKLLWIKQNIPSTWECIGLAMDLSDFLTWRATGCASRSLCAAVCKWTYQACTVPGSDKKHGWQDSIWTRIGLDEITRDDYRIIGLLGCEADGKFPEEFSRRLAIIAGTSAAHMLASEKCIFSPGAPGPFLSVMVPGMWLSEPGQSAAGALVDHIISTHPAYPQIVAKTKPGRRPEDTLNDLL